MTSEEQKILQEVEKLQEGRGLLALTRDLVFKAYFVKAEKVLVFLLNTFLPLPKGSVIVDVQITNPELTPKNLSPESGQFGKTNILDLKIHFEVADEDGNKRKEEALVEMQTSVDGHFTDRLLFYASRVYGQQLKKGEEYKDLVPVYCLTFATQNLKRFNEVKNEYIHVCQVQRNKAPHVFMSDKMMFIIVELDKFQKGLMKGVDTAIELWCQLIRDADGLKKDDFKELLKKGGKEMGEAVKNLVDISQDEKLRQEADSIEDQRRLQWDREYTARKEGREEGREEGLTKVAVKMLKSGFQIDIVCNMTGISKKNVERLKQSLDM